MLLMDAAHDIGGFLCRHALENAVGHFDQRDLETELAGDGCRFQTDITTANNQQPAAGFHFLKQPVSIALVADGQNPSRSPPMLAGSSRGAAPVAVTSLS